MVKLVVQGELAWGNCPVTINGTGIGLKGGRTPSLTYANRVIKRLMLPLYRSFISPKAGPDYPHDLDSLSVSLLQITSSVAGHAVSAATPKTDIPDSSEFRKGIPETTLFLADIHSNQHVFM
jgi:hypothetical protein